MIGPSQKQIDNGTYKLVDGVWHRRCTGPAHEEPVYLPATVKYFYEHKSGKEQGQLASRCRLCSNWDKLKSPGSNHGLVSISEARPIYLELGNRIGVAEMVRRTGLSRGQVEKVILGKRGHIQKRCLRLVMLELISVKRKGEMSINRQSTWRISRRANRGSGFCVSCGTHIDNFTRGCKHCEERQRGRQRRSVVKM